MRTVTIEIPDDCEVKIVKKEKKEGVCNQNLSRFD